VTVFCMRKSDYQETEFTREEEEKTCVETDAGEAGLFCTCLHFTLYVRNSRENQ
jgi:hypothetical protein